MIRSSSSASRRLGRSFLVAQARKKQITNVENLRTLSSSNNNHNASMSTSSSSFSDILNSFRLKAANALTSSLPEDERTELLNKFQPPPPTSTNDNQDDEEEEETQKGSSATIQTSIDEAVATARAQEAALHTKKWEREKEKLMKEAEDAARARVESDIAIQKRQLAFEAWKNALEREKDGKDEISTAEAATNNVQQQSEEEPEVHEHPILGPVLIDLGSKRIHIADVQALASIPVWKKQRIYRHGRAKTMANDKLKTLHLGLPGIVGIFEAKNGSLSIIDGQHRIGMLRVLQEGSSDFDFGRILVEVYPQRDDIDETTHAKEIFLEVNKAEPVKLVDLPGVASSKDRNIINDAATSIQERFVDMFKPSQRCRPPHLNIDNFRDALFASNVLDRHSLKTAKALEAWLLGQNEMLSVKFQDEEAQKIVSPTALKKAIKFDFYLGLDSSWLYN